MVQLNVAIETEVILPSFGHFNNKRYTPQHINIPGWITLKHFWFQLWTVPKIDFNENYII